MRSTHLCTLYTMKLRLRLIHQNILIFKIPTPPLLQEVDISHWDHSPSVEMHSSVGRELWPGRVLTWDYTPGRGLTFLVCFWCKHADHPPHVEGWPLFWRKACRSDAYWPQPAWASTATSPSSRCSPSIFLTRPSTLCLAWETTPVALPDVAVVTSSSFPRNGLLCWRLRLYLHKSKGLALG